MTTYAVRVTEAGRPDRWMTRFSGLTENLAEAITATDPSDYELGGLGVMGVELEDARPELSTQVVEVTLTV